MLRTAMAPATRAGGLLLLFGALAAPVWAQPPAPLPPVRVTVTDAQQLTIPGATCTLIRAGSPSGDTALADANGACVFERVQSGTYVVRVELDGFDPFTRDHLVVTAENPVDVAAVLTVAKLSQSVTVTAGKPEDTSVAAGSTPAAGNLEHHVLRKLPLPGAAIDAALPLVPGVLRSSTGEL